MVSARRACQLSGLVGLLVAAVLGYQAAALPYYTRIGPGPGFFPRWLCGILALLSLGVIARVTLGRDDAATRIALPDRQAALQIVGVVVALFAVAAATTTLGFRLTMLVFVAGLLVALGARSWIAIALCAVAGSFGVFHVFFYWLKVPLPIGALGI